MKKLCESTPRVACGTHRTHTHVAHGTQQCSSGMIFAESPKKGAGALDHNRLSTIIVLQQQQQWCCICDSMHVSHNNRGHQLYRSQGPIKKQLSLILIIGSPSNTARTTYRTRVMLPPPAMLAGGRRVYSVIASWL